MSLIPSNQPLVRKFAKGVRRPRYAAEILTKEVRRAALRSINPNDGIYVMEEEWDNLVILDACRYDAFAECNEISGELSRVQTRGTNTGQFIRENFAGRTDHDAVYVSGNSAVGAYSEYIDVHELIPVWETEFDDFGWEDRPEVAHPQTVVDHALEAFERYPDKRLVVHFLQPHCPYLVKDGERLPKDSHYCYLDVAVEKGVSDEELWQVYCENVGYVLDYVEELVEALDGRTVVTADHGELLGDSVSTLLKLLHPQSTFYTGGAQYEYGHDSHFRVPALVDVPWLVIEGEKRRRSRSEPPSTSTDLDEERIEEQLEVLGYK